jgi:transposase-like protein
MSVIDKLKNLIKSNRSSINSRWVTIYTKCPICHKDYFYKVPAGTKGRNKTCPICNYQDMRK